MVQENKRELCFSSSPEAFSPSFICKEHEVESVSKNANGANMSKFQAVDSLRIGYT